MSDTRFLEIINRLEGLKSTISNVWVELEVDQKCVKPKIKANGNADMTEIDLAVTNAVEALKLTRSRLIQEGFHAAPLPIDTKLSASVKKKISKGEEAIEPDE